jgi:predicted RNA binding protein YcfA (HicA-like mRNA interferase family)
VDKVSQFEKLLLKILCGSKDKDIDFDELCKILVGFGFKERIKGSHHIFYKEDIEEILNIQPNGSKAKPYQVKQVRNVILRYKLGGFSDV